MKAVKEILKIARARIKDRRRWCVGAIHRTTKDGRIQRCARGAIMEAISPENFYAADSRMENAAAKALLVGMIGPKEAKAHYSPIGGICDWNNAHKHKEVVSAFDKAIKALR